MEGSAQTLLLEGLLLRIGVPLAEEEKLEGEQNPEPGLYRGQGLCGPENWALGHQFPGRPLRALRSRVGRVQVSATSAASGLLGGGGGSLCACRSPRQRSAYRGPFVPGASSARRAAGNEAHSPHPLPRPLAVRQCHSRLARRPLAHKASTGNCLPVLMSDMGSWSRASLQSEVGSLGPASQGLAINHELGSSCQSSLQAAKQWPPQGLSGLVWGMACLD